MKTENVKHTPTPRLQFKMDGCLYTLDLDTGDIVRSIDGLDGSLSFVKASKVINSVYLPFIVRAVNSWNDIQALRARLHELETIIHDGITEDSPEVQP